MNTYRITWFLKRGGFAACEVTAANEKSAITKGKKEILDRFASCPVTTEKSFSELWVDPV